MRPLLAVAISIVILGGLQLFMLHRPRPSAHATPMAADATGHFRAEVDLSFVAGPDAFAVDVTSAPSLLVTFAGRELVRRTDPIETHPAAVISAIDDLKVGDNEIYVQATPREMSTQPSAVRIRIWREDQVLAEQTLWADPGERVAGPIILHVPRTDERPQTHDGPLAIPVATETK